ncbi:DUF500 and sh3 domain protein [Colletotrichum kahawae]|uniref:DUF500 and sh3 domain protein n=1 Tax=Colletotrichum kahawae TaxID=34407 RepID=A0AAD9YN77_COLKA|nr:DUF500 and sh3 domain protein [Colletotrichum kahawae]
MGFHNPIPSSMEAECKKCSKILTSFVDARRFGPDRVIPAKVLSSAKGLAVITVFKAGLFGSGRFGSGVVVARLPNGSWSAPSAVALAGTGIGSQIGLELVDFIFVLNSSDAVKTFSQAGSLSFGGSLSLAAGPFGRTAEAAGAANRRGAAAIHSYSKAKGFFAGISLEGSVMAERKGANDKMYGWPYSAGQLLSGVVEPPPAAAPLMEVLKMNAFGSYMFLPIGIQNPTTPSPGEEAERSGSSWDDADVPLVALSPRPLRSRLETGTMTSQQQSRDNEEQHAAEQRLQALRYEGSQSGRQRPRGQQIGAQQSETRAGRQTSPRQHPQRQESGRQKSEKPAQLYLDDQSNMI